MKQIYPVLKTERLKLRFLKREEAILARDYFLKNREHLSSTMPGYSDDYFEEKYWENRIENDRQKFIDGKSCCLFVLTEDENSVIGTVNFTEIIRGVFQGCFLGYGIDKEHQGKGLTTEAVKAGVDYVFEELNLHKILANYMPWNKASGKILEKLGFTEVGLAEKELYLNGQWRDHVETRLINDNWKNTIDK